jgi:simple sugar transport system ATP-binding protein
MISTSPVLIQFKSISKKFGTRWANKNISFAVEAGKVHGLIGENGAGKSTIMKILFGLYQADEGEILIHNQKVEIKSPLEAFKHKIGMVHQHFMLSPEHTALENILLIQDQQNVFEVFSKNEKINRIKAKAKEYGFEIPWDEKVKNLAVGIQQRIEILKLLNLDHEILIFDEPTAVLTPQEIDDLLKQINELRNKGKTIILITHKLKEVKKICDNITIFKKGECVGTFKNAELDEAKMAEKMVGHHVELHKRAFKAILNPKSILNLKNISFKANNHSYQFNLELSEGEVLGIAGIEGNGQNELINFLLNPTNFSLEKSLTKLSLEKPFAHNKEHLDVNTNANTNSEASPEYKFLSEDFLNLSKDEIRKKSFGVFPEDRLHLGVVAAKTGYENFILGYQRNSRWNHNGLLNWKTVKDIASLQFKYFKVEPETTSIVFNSYSGGNQQKIVVARELLNQPKFILASHPTRGVDIGAIEFIHEKLIQAQEQASGVLLISSELDELTKLSDRILVLKNGVFVKEFKRGDFNENEIGAYMLGSK